MKYRVHLWLCSILKYAVLSPCVLSPAGDVDASEAILPYEAVASCTRIQVVAFADANVASHVLGAEEQNLSTVRPHCAMDLFAALDSTNTRFQIDTRNPAIQHLRCEEVAIAKNTKASQTWHDESRQAVDLPLFSNFQTLRLCQPPAIDWKVCIVSAAYATASVDRLSAVQRL